MRQEPVLADLLLRCMLHWTDSCLELHSVQHAECGCILALRVCGVNGGRQLVLIFPQYIPCHENISLVTH